MTLFYPPEWATIATELRLEQVSTPQGDRVQPVSLQPFQRQYIFRAPSGLGLMDLPKDFPDPKYRSQHPAPSLPDPHLWTALVTQAIHEIMAGQRPAQSVFPYCTDGVYRGLLAVQQQLAKRKTRPSHRLFLTKSVHLMPVGQGGICGFKAIEGAVNTFDGKRYHATALRFRPCLGNWVIEELEVA